MTITFPIHPHESVISTKEERTASCAKMLGDIFWPRSCSDAFDVQWAREVYIANGRLPDTTIKTIKFRFSSRLCFYYILFKARMLLSGKARSPSVDVAY